MAKLVTNRIIQVLPLAYNLIPCPPTAVVAASYRLEETYPSLAYPDGSHPHACSDAHAGNANRLLGSPQLIEQRRDLSGSGAAEWMTKSNGTPLHGVSTYLHVRGSCKALALGLTFSIGIPSSLTHHKHCDANASLIS